MGHPFKNAMYLMIQFILDPVLVWLTTDIGLLILSLFCYWTLVNLFNIPYYVLCENNPIEHSCKPISKETHSHKTSFMG